MSKLLERLRDIRNKLFLSDDGVTYAPYAPFIFPKKLRGGYYAEGPDKEVLMVMRDYFLDEAPEFELGEIYFADSAQTWRFWILLSNSRE